MEGNRMRKISAAVLLLSLAMSFSAFADGTGGKAVRIISYDSSSDNNKALLNVETENAEKNSTADSNKQQNSAIYPLSNSADTKTLIQSGIVEASGLEIDKVNVPLDAKVLITLCGGKSSDSGVLNVYKKEADGNNVSFKLQLSARAKLGKNGLYKEKEGDSKTPVGIFKMNTPFGREDKLEGFPDNYIKVDGNYYWNGDSESPLYNKLVNISNYNNFDKKKSEHIIDYGKYYNYCIDTGYNVEGTPYKGSAIYLHCVVNNENTHGCIAIPEADMISIMRMYEEDHTYIAIYDNADIQAMYKK